MKNIPCLFFSSTGYRVRLRFEGYGIDSTRDFWIHLCTTESFPINGAVRVGKKLKPPRGMCSFGASSNRKTQGWGVLVTV